MKKRWLAFAMSISMACTLMYGNAVAAEDHTERRNVAATDEDSAEAKNPETGDLRIATPGNATETKASGSNGTKQETMQPSNTKIDPLMLARGAQVSDAIYLDAGGNDSQAGTSADTAVQTLEKLMNWLKMEVPFICFLILYCSARRY